MVLHAPKPVSSLPMPVVGYFSSPDDCGLGHAGSFYETDKASSPMFIQEPVSPAMTFGQTANLSEPMLQYPPPGHSLANYFPEASELSSVFSSLQLLNSGSQNVGLGHQEAHSPAIPSDYSEYCKTLEPLQATFPTPSELLAELTEKDMAVAGDEISSDVRSKISEQSPAMRNGEEGCLIPTDP